MERIDEYDAEKNRIFQVAYRFLYSQCTQKDAQRAKMSSVAELKKKFGGQTKVALTPEQHAAALRQRERDQAEAIRVAKVRAPSARGAREHILTLVRAVTGSGLQPLPW